LYPRFTEPIKERRFTIGPDTNTREPPASSVLLSWMSPGKARAATAQTSGVEIHHSRTL
jgi:hypothetical protein